MASLTDKTRAIYLVFLILFLIAIGFFVFDYFRIIDAEDYFPFLEKKPDLVNQDSESPTELEKLELAKAQEKLIEDREELEKLQKEIEKTQESLTEERERLEELRTGLIQKEEDIQEKKKLELARSEKVKVLADKVANMPPNAARDMLVNWPDYDIIEVFEQMDKDAEEDGRQTITTYLLTLFPAERRAIITNKWLDSDVRNVPN
ncbi:periplasmic-type flagellar collar protein FlbB [Leptospira sp. GIMC2001]|uniref:periplasmic-type flagellar collar protein FlbB n=1 Tax=Leptospira sp. GIMC2001 TaxID=1513297 RepID=UPI0023497E82|nr:flagellar protein FlbB [Leptospira sp. GIMC2001]WCL48261.1 flagellar protein FlbB [Leptospira sp. GIMC2001]